MKTFNAMALSLALGAGIALAQSAQNPSHSAMDQQIASYLHQEFSKNKKLADVNASVQDQIVTLSGTVPDYRTKLEAIKDAQQVQSANGFIDRLRVTGPTVPDQQLKKEIATRLTYDRIGMGQTFNAMDVKVDNGVVTIGGEVRDYADRDSAVDIVADTKGVKGVIDNIKVAPVSMMDDQIRLEAAQRIYGNPDLRKYAQNPAHPIRIVVNQGNVTLDGVVDSQLDKTLAGNAVRGMSNVFQVKNNLVVANGNNSNKSGK